MCGSRKDLRVEWGALSLSNENHGGWGWPSKEVWKRGNFEGIVGTLDVCWGGKFGRRWKSKE
jgi:hypothetical protein